MGEKCPFCKEAVDELETHTCRGTWAWEVRRDLVSKETLSAKDAEIKRLREELSTLHGAIREMEAKEG